jgi:nitrogen fixation/metabolism regulation signal transduction histidine kinase
MSPGWLAAAVLLTWSIVLSVLVWRRDRAQQARVRALEAAVQEQSARQAEQVALLRAIVEAAPGAILVYSERGQLQLCNQEARRLFFGGEAPAETDVFRLLKDGPDSFRRALGTDRDELVVLPEDGAHEVYHLARRHLHLEPGGTHTIVLVQRLTDELRQQEVESWKRLMRLVHHEVNNSLAPILSLLHTTRLLVAGAREAEKLTLVFETITERAEHLRGFLDAYARVARLPRPRPSSVEIPGLLGRLQALFPHLLVSATGLAQASFDAAQIEQALINLITNAYEAGGPREEVALRVEVQPGRGAQFQVFDRGQGLSAEALTGVLVPFFSTKPGGAGLGLSLCREIVDAHGGRLRLKNRPDGGAEVSFLLPPDPSVRLALPLTLTRE